MFTPPPPCCSRQTRTRASVRPYAAAEDDADDIYSRESIASLFASILKRTEDGASQDRISFNQMCAWHVGRVMLCNAGVFLQRSVQFQ